MKISIDGKLAEIHSGADGKSAYQYAVAGGYTGTEEEFQALMGSGPWVQEKSFGIQTGLYSVAVNKTRLLTSSGWYRILKSRYPTSMSIAVFNAYGDGGPGSLRADLHLDNFIPNISVTFNNGNNGYTIYTGLRLVKREDYIFVDIQYAKNVRNNVVSAAQCISRYQNTVVPMELAQITELDENDTILQEKTFGIVLPESDAISAAIERGLAL